VAQTTAISWTATQQADGTVTPGATWNPVIGCSHVSDGCTRCYAESLALRWRWKANDGQPMTPWTNQDKARNVVLKPHRMYEPLKWKTPRRVFVNSLSDVFHEEIPVDYIEEMFDVMQLPGANRHTYQVLTKRPARALEVLRMMGYDASNPLPAHIWLGVTVEDRKALPRIDLLRTIAAPIRFLSCEPLLEALGRLDLTGISWVIVGGESGPGHRVMTHAWAREIRDACVEQGVAMFFKQSSGPHSEMQPTLLEEDGSRTEWHQWPVVDSATA
jgi:protein gp37